MWATAEQLVLHLLYEKMQQTFTTNVTVEDLEDHYLIMYFLHGFRQKLSRLTNLTDFFFSWIMHKHEKNGYRRLLPKFPERI